MISPKALLVSFFLPAMLFGFLVGPGGGLFNPKSVSAGSHLGTPDPGNLSRTVNVPDSSGQRSKDKASVNPSPAAWLTPLLSLDPCYDVDGDGYGDPASDGCRYPARDCNDTNADVNPGIKEWPPTAGICKDGMDNDCDGDVDSNDPGCVEYYTEALVSHTFIGDETAMNWHADDACWPYTLPFTFPYFSASYGSVYVCSNGFLDFTSNDAGPSNSLEDLKARAMIAPVWADLNTTQGDNNIYIHQPTSDSVAIRWDARTFVGGHSVNVECILYESGMIQFNYGGEGNDLCDQGGANAVFPTVGISKGADDDYYLSPYNGECDLTGVSSDRYTLP